MPESRLARTRLAYQDAERDVFTHRAYGLRRDGTIGPAEAGNPVAESVDVHATVSSWNAMINWTNDTQDRTLKSP